MNTAPFIVIAAGLVAITSSTAQAQSWSPTQYQDTFVHHGYFNIMNEVLDVGGGCALLRASGNRVYIYRLQQDDTWVEEAEIFEIEPGTGFGFRGSIDGDVAIITAPNWVDNEGVERGRAYAYEHDAKSGTWEFTYTFEPLPIDEKEAGMAGFNFGNQVTLEHDLVAIADPRAKADLGYVLFFERTAPGVWQQRNTYYGIDDGDRFGSSMEIYFGLNGLCAIGSTQTNLEDANGTIEFFIQNENGNWTPQPTLIEGPGISGWPSDIDIHFSRMAVSGTNQYGLPGIVQIWEGDEDDWTLRTTLLGGGEDKGFFGNSVQLWTSQMLVTQYFTLGLPSDGAALLYERNGEGEWRLEHVFNGALNFPTAYGSSAAMIGDHVLVGNNGGALVRDFIKDEFDYPPDEPPSLCEGDINGDGEVNGADLGLLLAAWGTCL